MRDIWTIGSTASTRALRACGFSPHQAQRLVALRLRYERDALLGQTAAQKHFLFVRWLVDRGRLDDGLSAALSRSAGTITAAQLSAASTPLRLTLSPKRRWGGGKMERTQPPRPRLSWPAALRAVRAWLEPRIMLWRYWRAWSTRPPPRPLQLLLDRLTHGHGIRLYLLP